MQTLPQKRQWSSVLAVCCYPQLEFSTSDGCFWRLRIFFGRLQPQLNQNLFPISFVAGISLMVAGMTLSARAEQFNGRFLRRPCLTAGLTLLTVSVSAILSEYLLATRMGPIQYGLLVEPYEAFFWFLAFAGVLILFLGLSKWSALPSLAKKSFCALAFGEATSLTLALISPV